MSGARILALVLVVAGVLALVYGGFTYTRTRHSANIGPVELAVKDRETVYVPMWAGVGAIAVGGVLLLMGSRRRA